MDTGIFLNSKTNTDYMADKIPNFDWPAYRETLEDDDVVLQSDPEMFKSVTDFLSKTTENITSTITDTLNSTESTTAQSINVQNETYSQIEDMFGSAASTEISMLQSSVADEPLVESVKTNPANIITEIFYNTVSTEKPPYSTSWEQPLIASSQYPLINTSKFGINMNTDSSSTIDTVKDMLAEAVLKEKGLFKDETTEEPITTTSYTINTLRDMFMKAVAKEQPLLNTAKTESSLIDFKTSTEKPLFKTFTVEKPFLETAEKTVSQNMSLNEAPIEFSTNTNSAMDKMTDIFNNPMPTEKALYENYVSEQFLNDSSVSTTNSIETLEGMLSTTSATKEPSIEFGSININSTGDVMRDVFNGSTQTGQSTFQTIFEKIEDSVATKKPSIDLNLNMKTKNTMGDIFNRTFPTTEQPIFRTTSTTGESAMEFGETAFEMMKDILSTTEEAPIEIGQIIKTNSSSTGVFNISTPTEQPLFQLTNNTFETIENTLASDEPSIKFTQSTIEQLKDLMSTTEATKEPAIDFGFSTKPNGINMIADVVNATTPTEQPFFQTTHTENIKEMLVSTEEPPIIFDWDTKTNGSTDIIADVFNRSTLTERPFFLDASTIEKMKDTSTTQKSVTEFGHNTFENMKEPSMYFRHSTIDMMADIFNTTATEQPFVQTTSTPEDIKELLFSTKEPPIEISHKTLEHLQDMLSSTEATKEPSIVFDLGTKTNGTTDMIAEVFNKSTPTEQPVFLRTSPFEKIEDILSTTQEYSTEFNQSTNDTFDVIKDMFNASNSTNQTLVQDPKPFEKIVDVLATEEPTTELSQSTNTKSIFDVIADIFNGRSPTQKSSIPYTTEASSIEFGESTFEKIQDIFSTTREPPIQFGQSTNSNGIDMIENIFNGTTSTNETFVQNTSTIGKIKDILSTIWATEEPSTEEALIDFIQSSKTNGTSDMMKDVYNTYTSTEQTFEEPINITATSSGTAELAGIFRSAGVQGKLNSTIDIFTTEMSTKSPFSSSPSLPEINSIYFNNDATSNSTEIFGTDPSIIQSTINTDFMDSSGNNASTEDVISTSISSIKKTFEDVLSTVSSNFNSTTKEALGNTDEQDETAIESSWTIYIILGVILAVLIILTVGGYIMCRKYRRNHKSGGGYYVTHLKDYSDSSVKTISDYDSVNIRL